MHVASSLAAFITSENPLHHVARQQHHQTTLRINFKAKLRPSSNHISPFRYRSKSKSLITKVDSRQVTDSCRKGSESPVMTNLLSELSSLIIIMNELLHSTAMGDDDPTSDYNPSTKVHFAHKRHWPYLLTQPIPPDATFAYLDKYPNSYPSQYEREQRTHFVEKWNKNSNSEKCLRKSKQHNSSATDEPNAAILTHIVTTSLILVSATVNTSHKQMIRIAPQQPQQSVITKSVLKSLLATLYVANILCAIILCAAALGRNLCDQTYRHSMLWNRREYEHRASSQTSTVV